MTKLITKLLYWTWLLLEWRENFSSFIAVFSRSVGSRRAFRSHLFCSNWTESTSNSRQHHIDRINFHTSRSLNFNGKYICSFSNLFDFSFFNRVKIWNHFWNFANTLLSRSCLLAVCQIHLAVLMQNLSISAFDEFSKFWRNIILLLWLNRCRQGSKVINCLIVIYYYFRWTLLLRQSLLFLFYILGFQSKRWQHVNRKLYFSVWFVLFLLLVDVTQSLGFLFFHWRHFSIFKLKPNLICGVFQRLILICFFI